MSEKIWKSGDLCYIHSAQWGMHICDIVHIDNKRGKLWAQSCISDAEFIEDSAKVISVEHGAEEAQAAVDIVESIRRRNDPPDYRTNAIIENVACLLAQEGYRKREP